MNPNLLFLFTALFSILIVNGFPVKRDLSGETRVYSGSVNELISKLIVPPYRTAYTTLNDNIVQPLLLADTESDQATIEHLIESLLQASKKVHNLLHQATTASESIRRAVDEQVEQQVLNLAIQEEKVRQSQVAVTQARINVQHTQHQVNIAESAVRDAENSLHAANHELHEAEQAVEKARRCGLGRRKKRFLGKLVRALNPINIIEHVVVKPICSVVNAGGIDRAKDRRSMASQHLHNTQQRLQNHRQTLSTHQVQLSTAQTQLTNANQALQTTQSILSDLQIKQSFVASLTAKIKNVEIHLNNVLHRSNVLASDAAKLIDFELVIAPLNSIYEEMINNKIMESFGFEITAETARQINTNFQTLSEKMSKMPINQMLQGSSREALDDNTDSSKIDSEESHGYDTTTEIIDAPTTDSTETVDEEITEPLDDDQTGSEESHGYDTTTEVTDTSTVDSTEATDNTHTDEESNEPSDDYHADSAKTDSEESHGYDTTTEVIDTPAVDSAEAIDNTNTDEEANGPSDDDHVDSAKTDSEEAHSYDTTTAATDIPAVDLAEVSDDAMEDDEIADPSKTGPEEAYNYDVMI